MSKDWSYEEIKIYFDSVKLPNSPIRLNDCTVVNNPEQFVKGHLGFLKGKDNSLTYYPYVLRLRNFAKIIKLQDE